MKDMSEEEANGDGSTYVDAAAPAADNTPLAGVVDPMYYGPFKPDVGTDTAKHIWLAMCHIIFIAAQWGIGGSGLVLVYLMITHAAMWMVKFASSEPKISTQASMTAAAVSAALAFLTLVQYSTCSGSSIECLPVAWVSGTSLVTTIACIAVDIASADFSKIGNTQDSTAPQPRDQSGHTPAVPSALGQTGAQDPLHSHQD